MQIASLWIYETLPAKHCTFPKLAHAIPTSNCHIKISKKRQAYTLKLHTVILKVTRRPNMTPVSSMWWKWKVQIGESAVIKNCQVGQFGLLKLWSWPGTRVSSSFSWFMATIFKVVWSRTARKGQPEKWKHAHVPKWHGHKSPKHFFSPFIPQQFTSCFIIPRVGTIWRKRQRGEHKRKNPLQQDVYISS